MSRLSDLYNAMETLRKEGLPVNEELEQKASQAEEEIIKNEILPILKQRIEPALQEVQRELVLVVDYRPGQPISVALSRKVKISQITDATPITMHPSADRLGKPVVSDQPAPENEDHAPTRQVANPTKGLRVTFADGTTICHGYAIDTFKTVLQRIGLRRIHDLGIVHCGYNLVSKEQKPPEPGRCYQHQLDGWFIWSNTNNRQKKDDLHFISDSLGLHLQIEDGKPSK